MLVLSRMAEETATSTQPSPPEKRRKHDAAEDTAYQEILEPPNIKAGYNLARHTQLVLENIWSVVGRLQYTRYSIQDI